MKAIARALSVARSHLAARLATVAAPTSSESPKASRAGDAVPSASPSTTSLADAELVSRVQRLVGERPSYGYRRVTALLNRQAHPRVNHKRLYRLMRKEKLLLERSTGRAAHGRRVKME